MAGRRTGIGINVKLNGKEQVKKDIDNLFEYAKSKKDLTINLKTDGLVDSLNKVQTLLTDLTKNISGLNNVNIGNSANNQKAVNELQKEKEAVQAVAEARKRLVQSNVSKSKINVDQELKSYDALQQRLDEIKNSMGSISNIKMSSTQTGRLQSAIITYKNTLGQTVTETMKLIKRTDEAGNVISSSFRTVGSLNVVDNISKQETQMQKLQSRFEKMISTLDTYKSKGTFYGNVFNSNKMSLLTNKLDTSNLENASIQVDKLSKEMDKLQASSSKLNVLQKATDSLRNGFTNLTKSLGKDIIGDSNVGSLIKAYKKDLDTLDKMKKNLKQGNGQSLTFKEIDSAIESTENRLKGLKAQIESSVDTSKLLSRANELFNILKAKNPQTIFKELQNQLNSFNLKTPKQELTDFISKVNLLGNSGKNITTLENKLTSVANQFNKLASEKGLDIINSDKAKPQLQAYESALQNAKKIQEELRNGKFIDDNTVNNSINNIKNSFTSLKQVVENVFKASKSNSSAIDPSILSQLSVVKTRLKELDTTFLNKNVVAKLQEQFNSLNLNPTQEKINAFKNTLNNLGNNSKTFVKLKGRFDDISNSVEQLKGKMGNVSNNEKYTNSLKEVEKQLEILKNAMNTLSNGGTIKSSAISDMLNNSRIAMKNFNREANGGSGLLGTMSKIQSTLSKFGIYTSLAITMRKLFNEIKEGVQYVKYLDDSFTNIKMTMNITKEEFDDMSAQVDTLAKKLGVTSEYIHDIAQVYSNANTNVSEIMSKVEGTAKLANISGMNGLDTTKAVQSITNQFKLMSDAGTDAGQVTEHIGDVLTAVSRNMTYDFAKSFGELV